MMQEIIALHTTVSHLSLVQAKIISRIFTFKVIDFQLHLI